MAESSSKVILPPQAKALSYIVIGSALISFGPFFVEFSGVDAMTSSFYRLIIGGLSFLLIAAIKKEKFPKPSLLWIYLFAGLMTTLDLVACNQSILYIGSGMSTILSNLEVIFLILLGFIFYSERLPKLFLPLCILIVLGIGCLMQPYFSEMHPRYFWGISYALAASFIYSIYLMLLKMIGKHNPENSPATTLGIVCFFGAVILGLYMKLHPSATFALPDLQSIICVLSYSILSQIFGWWFITTGLNKVSLSISGMLFLTQPAITFIGDCIFLKRNTQPIQLFGGTILLLAVYLTVQSEKRKESVVCNQN